MEQQQPKLLQQVVQRLKDYPLYSQEKANGNPMVAAKLFNAAGTGTWYLTEFDGERIAFGYVTGMGGDEWGYIDIIEMAEFAFRGWHCIEVDLHFKPCHFQDLKLSA